MVVADDGGRAESWGGGHGQPTKERVRSFPAADMPHHRHLLPQCCQCECCCSLSIHCQCECYCSLSVASVSVAVLSVFIVSVSVAVLSVFIVNVSVAVHSVLSV